MKKSYLFFLLFCAAVFSASPDITAIMSGSQVLWQKGQFTPCSLVEGQEITILGSGFGSGVDVDYSKVLFGKIRALERDLPMYEGKIDYLNALFFELDNQVDSWKKDILSWNDNQITLRVPSIAYQGPLKISVANRTGSVASLVDPSKPFMARDPLTERIAGFNYVYGVVSRLGDFFESNEVPLTIENSRYEQMLKEGESIFWNYSFNIGIVHHIKGLDWSKIVTKKTIDPVTNKTADPETLFGAIPLRAGEVPLVASTKVHFDSYPSQNPVKPIAPGVNELTSGYATPSPYVGYPYNDYKSISGHKAKWIGMTCASCHSQKVTYEAEPGVRISKVFPGLPNGKWSMRWSILGMKGIKGKEKINGVDVETDRSLILYAVPNGTGEHTLVRPAGESSIYDNDFLFSPSAIPIITRHTPMRRALSRTEMIAGFEGSYLHAEEPDGAVGALNNNGIKAFTVYMDSLDKDDATLKRIAVYRTLGKKGLLSLVENASEGKIVKEGYSNYPALEKRLEAGKSIFNRDCRQCHTPNFGTHSDERMYGFDEVGTYFAPTLFQQQVQSVRTAIVRNLYFSEERGLLHDAHVKSVEDLIHPDRCIEGTALYNKYYTLNAQTFKIAKGNAAQERALRAIANFVDVEWDKANLYYDYQGMRKNFGVREFKTKSPVQIPVAPHPWCVKQVNEVEDLTLYLMTL